MPTLTNPLDAPIAPRAYRGRILHSLSADELVFLPDGGLLIDADGRVEACDDWRGLEAAGRMAGFEVACLPADALLIPGFVDMHVHLPQMEVAGCQEKDLLAWLEQHIFAAESRFSDVSHAQAVSQWFFE